MTYIRLLSALSLVLAVSLSGCASVETQLPHPKQADLNRETKMQSHLAFERLLAQEKRLDAVGARILQANSRLCEKTRFDFGIVTHSLKSYPKHLRWVAAKELGAREEPSVLFVRKDGPADKVGVKAGDIVLGKNNKPAGAYDKSFAHAKSLIVLRAGQQMTLPIKGASACYTPIKLKTASAINAWADGKHITVTTAMMDFAKSDRELALVLGHELAHNTMGHVKKAIWNSLISGFATRTTRPFEAEADYVGLYYMARAGYKLDDVEGVWRRLGVLFPKNVVRAKSHPVTPERLLAIRLTRQEILKKQKSGEVLLPNLLKPAQHP